MRVNVAIRETTTTQVSVCSGGVSVLIASRSRPDMLQETVMSVMSGETTPDEIVIIDQSDRPHPQFAQTKPGLFGNVRYVWTHAPGVARARNQAMALAGHELLVLIDDDMWVSRTWLGELVSAATAAGPETVVTGSVVAVEADKRDVFAPSLKDEPVPASYVGRIGRDVLYTGNMALHRTVLDCVGPFDERLGPGTGFPAAEDNDFGFRLLEAGYHIQYVPSAVVYHRAWRTQRDFTHLRWAYGLGRGAYYAKHIRLRDTYMARRMAQDVGSHLWRALHVRRIGRHRALGDGLLALGIVSGAIQWALTTRRLSARRILLDGD